MSCWWLGRGLTAAQLCHLLQGHQRLGSPLWGSLGHACPPPQAEPLPHHTQCHPVSLCPWPSPCPQQGVAALRTPSPPCTHPTNGPGAIPHPRAFARAQFLWCLFLARQAEAEMLPQRTHGQEHHAEMPSRDEPPVPRWHHKKRLYLLPPVPVPSRCTRLEQPAVSIGTRSNLPGAALCFPACCCCCCDGGGGLTAEPCSSTLSSRRDHVHLPAAQEPAGGELPLACVRTSMKGESHYRKKKKRL